MTGASQRPAKQLAQVRNHARTARRPTPAAPAARLPVAVVAVDISLAHLDRPFDYLVPEQLDEPAVPGCRVRVRFAGKLVDGFLLRRTAESRHDGHLGHLERVVSSEVVLTEDVSRLCRAVADRYAGSFADVVRLAVPPRHARVEQADPEPKQLPPIASVDPTAWSLYPAGEALLGRLAAGDTPRSSWGALPGASWAEPIAQAVVATLQGGRGSVVCLPDTRDVARLDAVLVRLLGPRRHAVLTADLGPQARYRAFLEVARGRVQVAIGTRAAAFAPVRNLGLAAIWDDGDDLHAEPRAPYPHAREILLLRAHDQGAAVLLAGYARSVEAQALVESGWCVGVGAAAEQRRSYSARVLVAGSTDIGRARDPAGTSARLPNEAMAALREGLAAGPVLVSVARSGYRIALACQHCREPARCVRCSGPLAQVSADAEPACRWCGQISSPWTCSHCGGGRLRAPMVGERRTAEELGRAFPGVRVRTSSSTVGTVDRVDDRPQIVIATPGAEPVADEGYCVALLLDTGLALSRPDMRTAEESVRRWLNVIALVRPAARAGRVVVVGDATSAVLQTLIRADPAGFASRELSERRSARLPPAVHLATVVGPLAEIAALETDWPQPADVLGPVPVAAAADVASARIIVRVPRSQGPELAQAMHVLQSLRSARKAPHLRVQIDPVEIG